VGKAVIVIVAQFAQKNAAAPFTGCSGTQLDASRAIKSRTHFGPITWLVIK